VSGHVDVRVVTLVGLILDVGNRDCDTASLLLRSLVDLVERRKSDVRVLGVESLCDRRGEGRLTVVDMPIVPTLTWGFVRSNFFLAIVADRSV